MCQAFKTRPTSLFLYYPFLALPSKNRIRTKKDFDEVFKKGNAVRGNFLFIRYAKNTKPGSRFGLVVPAKAFKRATERNRIKRIVSETIRTLLKDIDNRCSFIITVRKGTEEEIIRELPELLLKIKT